MRIVTFCINFYEVHMNSKPNQKCSTLEKYCSGSQRISGEVRWLDMSFAFSILYLWFCDVNLPLEESGKCMYRERYKGWTCCLFLFFFFKANSSLLNVFFWSLPGFLLFFYSANVAVDLLGDLPVALERSHLECRILQVF